MPWWHSGASGGAAWPWMGAALAKTTNITVGTGVTAPILRYHPAIVAQTFATLANMFPNRVILGLGRGEALNEVTTGNNWPSNSERFLRLKESIKLIKKLWTGDWVNFKGDYYWVKVSRLYTRPDLCNSSLHRCFRSAICETGWRRRRWIYNNRDKSY